jgi:hypothetical protein
MVAGFPRAAVLSLAVRVSAAVQRTMAVLDTVSMSVTMFAFMLA